MPAHFSSFQRSLTAALLPLLLLGGCLDDPPAGSDPHPDAQPRPDGAIPDADPTPPDGTLADGNVPDGTLPDGMLPDGMLPDGTLPDGDTPDADPADATPEPDAAPPFAIGCGDALATLARGVDAVACDAWDGECSERLNACCTVYLSCDDGAVTRQVGCTDDCAQGCATYDAAHCALDPGCGWYDGEGACGPAPEGVIEGPICAPRRGAPCSTDDECGEGRRCQGFLYDPCAGSNCDACGAVGGYCVY